MSKISPRRSSRLMTGDRLDDLLLRRAKTERVTDLVNLDRVRGLLRTIYWRKRFLATRDARKLTLNAEAEGER